MLTLISVNEAFTEPVCSESPSSAASREKAHESNRTTAMKRRRGGQEGEQGREESKAGLASDPQPVPLPLSSCPVPLHAWGVPTCLQHSLPVTYPACHCHSTIRASVEAHGNKSSRQWSRLRRAQQPQDSCHRRVSALAQAHAMLPGCSQPE